MSGFRVYKVHILNVTCPLSFFFIALKLISFPKNLYISIKLWWKRYFPIFLIILVEFHRINMQSNKKNLNLKKNFLVVEI